MKKYIHLLLALTCLFVLLLFKPAYAAEKSGYCGIGMSWTLDDNGKLQISGSGYMDYHDYDYQYPWYNYRADIHNIILDEGVVRISKYAFSGCSNAVSISIPQSLLYIGDYAFQDCSSLSEINVPDKVKNELGIGAFSGCSSLTSVTLPADIYELKSFLFENCRSLAEFSIPNRVTTIMMGAFQGCTSLQSIIIPDGVTNIYTDVFSGCSSLTSVVLPNNITYIRNNLFFDCSSLNTIIIPETVTQLGDACFRNCSSLVEISVPSSVNSIGTSAFAGCSGLNSFNIPSSITKINNCTFSDCSSLTSITVPSNVTAIGYGAFENCNNLTKVTIKSNLSSIEAFAFYGCNNLSSITIPRNVSYIEEHAFSDKTIKYTGIGTNAAKALSKAGFTFRESGSNYELRYIYSSNNNTIEGLELFSCDKDSVSISISKNVTKIGDSAFSDCSGLTTVTIPSAVTAIGEKAFFNCAGLTSINIPANVETIGKGAFAGCQSMEAISVSEDNLFYCAIDGILFNNSVSSILCWPKGKSGVVYMPESVVEIGGYAFYECLNIVNFQFTNEFISIGDYAFYGCSELETISVPATVALVGKEAFSHCDKLIIHSSCASAALEYAIANNVEHTIVHEWDSPEYDWNNNNAEVVAMHHCIHNVEHIETESVGTDYAVILPAACVEEGTGLFTSKEFSNASFQIQTKEVAIPMTGHTPETDVAIEPTEYKPGLTEGSHCSVCNKVLVEQQYIHPLIWRTDENEEGLTILQYYGTESQVSIPDKLGEIDVVRVASGAFSGTSCPERVYFPNGITFEDDTFDLPVTIYCFQYSDAYYKARRLNYGVVCADNPSFGSFHIINFSESEFVLERGETTEINYLIWPLTGQEQIEWTSSHPEQVSIIDGTATAILPGRVIITLTVGNESNYVVITSWCDAEEFTLSETDLYIETEQSAQLKPDTIEPAGAKLEITWQSSNTNIAEIDASGWITAWQTGEATVTATSHNEITHSCIIHVCYPVENVEFTETESTITAGNKLQLSAVVTTRDHQYINKLVKFISSNDTVLTVDKNGIIKAHKPGKATIFAYASVDKYDSVDFTIIRPDLDSMSKLMLPDQLTTIEIEAFAEIDSEAVFIPEGCTEIKSRAFANCQNLKYVWIPKSVISIAQDAFENSDYVFFDYE